LSASSWLLKNIVSNSNSPVVIVKVLINERAGDEKADRIPYKKIKGD